MRILTGNESVLAESYFQEALKESQKSGCLSSARGCVIVNNGLIIGRGTNSPPGNEKIMACFKDELPSTFRSDHSCCVHAEQRAIMDALTLGPNLVRGATLYYIRRGENGKVFSRKPSCTICSKLALDVGIKEFVLWHENGITAYEANEYNQLSFAFRPDA